MHYKNLFVKKDWKKFHEIVIEDKEALVANFEVFHLGNIKKPFTPNLVWLLCPWGAERY